MSKYIDAEKLIAEIESIRLIPQTSADYNDGRDDMKMMVLDLIDSLQQEQPMPDSTKLIELWHEDKEMLKEKDFRDDPWRLAYNAFMCGFGRGIAVNKQARPEGDLEKAAQHVYESWMRGTMNDVRRDMAELGKVLNARKEE